MQIRTCLTENGRYLPVEKGTILAKVWYYNGDDKTITRSSMTIMMKRENSGQLNIFLNTGMN
jgi:hypothetical protein